MGIEITSSKAQDWIFEIQKPIPDIEPDELTAELIAEKLSVEIREAYRIISKGIKEGKITSRKVRIPNGRKISAYRKKGE